MTDEEKEHHRKFKDFNEEAIDEMETYGVVPPQEEEDLAWIILYWVLYVGMWGILYVPGLYDTVIFIMYALYDFGSAWELYLEDHLTGWSYWAIASFVWSLIHMTYITFLLVYLIVEFCQPEPFVGIIYQSPYLWITIIFNSLALIPPLSKLIVVHIEKA